MTVNSFNNSITISKQSDTVISFLTENKFVNKNIDLNISAQTATPTLDGGKLTGKGASVTFSNATVSSTNDSGVLIQAKGQAGRAAVLYNGAVEGWVSKNDNDTALSSIGALTWNGDSYYLKGVNLTNGKSFEVTIPDGNSTITMTCSVDNNGNYNGDFIIDSSSSTATATLISGDDYIVEYSST